MSPLPTELRRRCDSAHPNPSHTNFPHPPKSYPPLPFTPSPIPSNFPNPPLPHINPVHITSSHNSHSTVITTTSQIQTHTIVFHNFLTPNHHIPRHPSHVQPFSVLHTPTSIQIWSIRTILLKPIPRTVQTPPSTNRNVPGNRCTKPSYHNPHIRPSVHVGTV